MQNVQKKNSVPSFPRGFTLLELLVVISIIAILAGMIVPTFYYAKRRASEAKARVAVKQLETAFKSYLDTYKVWPDAILGDTAYEIRDDGPPVKLFSMLRGSDSDSNPQGIAFFEFESTNNLAAYDPWSNPSDPSTFEAYRVMFDRDYDNKIMVVGQDVYRCVLVWSFGEGRTNDYGEGDDVASWK